MLNMMWKSNKCWKFFLLAAACLDGVNIFHADAPSSLPDSHAAYFKETHSSFRLVFLFLCFDFPILQQISKKAFGIPYLVLTISAPLRTLSSKSCWWLMLEVATGKSDGDKKYDQICLIHLKKKWWWLWSWWRWRQWYECYDMTRLIYSLPTPNGLLWLFLGQIVKLCSILFTLPIAPKYFYALSVFQNELNWSISIYSIMKIQINPTWAFNSK